MPEFIWTWTMFCEAFIAGKDDDLKRPSLLRVTTKVVKVASAGWAGQRKERLILEATITLGNCDNQRLGFQSTWLV